MANGSSNVKYFRVVLGSILFVMTTLSLTFVILGIVKKDKVSTPCKFLNVVITEKYIIEGDSGFLSNKPDQFVVKSVYTDDDKKTTYTTLTTITIYNSLEVGDEVYICLEHDELVYNDLCPGG